MSIKNRRGWSLIEILVVVVVFAIIAALASGSLLLSLRGSRRSEASIAVRENLNYAVSIIERQLHNAETVTCPNPTTISYTDLNFQSANFSCDLVGGRIASSSAQLTASNVKVTGCSFTCTAASPGVPPSVQISITGKDVNATGLEQQQITVDTQIMLRTY